jgi:hypothetical protein
MHGTEHVKLNIHNQISHHKGAPVNSTFFRNLAITFITARYTHMGNPVNLRTNFCCLFSTYRQRRWSHVLRLSRQQNSIKIFSSWRPRQVVQTHEHSTDRLPHQVYCIRTMVMVAVSETLVCLNYLITLSAREGFTERESMSPRADILIRLCEERKNKSNELRWLCNPVVRQRSTFD